MEDCNPPDFLAFLAEANLLPPATYLTLQNRKLDGKASEGGTLISLGLVDATRLAQLHVEHLGERYIDLTHFPPNPDLLKILRPATALKMGLAPWRLSTGVTVISIDRPEYFDQNQAYLRQIFSPMRRLSPLPGLSTSIMFQAGDKGLTQMPLHRLIGRQSIPIRNCRHNRLMLIQGHRPPPLNGKRGRREERHGAINQIQLLYQKPIVRRQMQLLVKSLI